MERESFVFYKSFLAGIDVIQDEAEQLKAYKYIIRYGVYGEEPEEKNSIAYGFFAMAKPQIDANNKKYTDGCKGGRPHKNWDNSQKPKVSKKITSGYENGKPNVNDNVNDNVNENENVSSMLDADASRGIVAKKNVYDEEVEALRLRLSAELNVEVIDKVVEFDKVKKGKKIRKYAEAQIKAFITTLNTRPTDKEKIDMLNTCIGNDYQGIYRNNRAQPVKSERPSGNLFH